MFDIIAVYNGEREVVDTADTEETASYLTEEYRIAYGRGWWVFYQKQRRSRREKV